MNFDFLVGFLVGALLATYAPQAFSWPRMVWKKLRRTP